METPLYLRLLSIVEKLRSYESIVLLDFADELVEIAQRVAYHEGWLAGTNAARR